MKKYFIEQELILQATGIMILMQLNSCISGMIVNIGVCHLLMHMI